MSFSLLEFMESSFAFAFYKDIILLLCICIASLSGITIFMFSFLEIEFFEWIILFSLLVVYRIGSILILRFFPTLGANSFIHIFLTLQTTYFSYNYYYFYYI